MQNYVHEGMKQKVDEGDKGKKVEVKGQVVVVKGNVKLQELRKISTLPDGGEK